jgi:hypothetical protein
VRVRGGVGTRLGAFQRFNQRISIHGLSIEQRLAPSRDCLLQRLRVPGQELPRRDIDLQPLLIHLSERGVVIRR